MVVTSDVHLIGSDWAIVLKEYAQFFNKQRNYELFVLAAAIGIMYDKRIEEPDKDNDEELKYVARNVIQNRNREPGCMLDLLFQTAILSSRTVSFNQEERMDLAFGENQSFNRIGFLTEFSNFGATKLVELIGDTPAETMNNLNVFLVSSYEGSNYEIDDLPEDAFDDFVPEESSEDN